MYSRIFQRFLNAFTRAPSVCSACSECHNMPIPKRLASVPSKWHGHWEPDNLKLEPDIPEYETITIHLRGYDYPVLESFTKYVHNTTEMIFNLDNEAWPIPAKSIQVRTFRPQSTVVNEKYDIHKYERVVTLDDVPSTHIPLLAQFLRQHIPQGVEVTMKEHDPEDDEQRYVPDYNVLELKAQRDNIESGKLMKKKKV